MNNNRIPSHLNPWLNISASDYESHMDSEQVGQLSILKQIFADTVITFSPQCLAVVGCATGNGFDHIDPKVTQRVIGIDINKAYLDILRNRYIHHLSELELICSDITSCTLQSESIDLIHAALIFEFVDPRQVLPKLVSWLKPDGILSVVLQVPSCESEFVSETGYTSLKQLESIIQPVNHCIFKGLANKYHLKEIESREIELKLGKRFNVGYYQKLNGSEV